MINDNHKAIVSYIFPENMLDWFEVTDVQIAGTGVDETFHIFLSKKGNKLEKRSSSVPMGSHEKQFIGMLRYVDERYHSTSNAVVGLTEMVRM